MKFKKIVALATAALMLLSVLPISAFAANDYTINSTVSTDDYYNLISKTDWDIAPGISESQIVLNNDEGTRRQVLFVMEADVTNEYVKVINSYNGMVPQYGDYKTGVMSEQAAFAEANGYGNVVGAMNTTLSWYSGYSADRVGEPLGFIMLDAEVLFDPANCGYEYGKVGFPSVVVINKDFDENGNPRPDDIPKVEMPQITSSADLDGWEEQVIPASSGYIVKDGVNQYSADHTSSSAPRSVVGIKPDGTVVIMLNDGRQEPYSAGMTMYELAEVMLDLGCSFAVNCDGGGSSTYLSQRPGEELKVNNSPSDGSERATTSGILFISTAPSTNEFVRAEITTSHQYYTPSSNVQFDAIATNLIGEQVDMPEDACWELEDPSFGTITDDGLFTSNGKIGKVTAKIVHNGEVKGEKSVEIVWPTDFAFSSEAMTIPFGKTVSINLIATYNGEESYVALKDGDIEFTLSEPSLGTIEAFSFTSSADENATITSGTLTASINGLVDDIVINLGKGSEVIFDFESDNPADDWFVYDYNVNHAGGSDNSHLDLIDVVTPETGKVHSGNSALAVTVDYSDARGNGWLQYRMCYNGEYIEIKNAKKLGFWIWMPEEAYANEWDLHIRCIDKNGVAQRLAPVLTDIGYCFQNQDEAGWRYFTVDLSAHPVAYFGYYPDSTVSTSLSYIQFYNYQQQWQADDSVVNTQSKFTYFIDDITVEYSDAADDTDAPVFGTLNVVDNNGVISEMQGQTVSYNTFGAEVTVADFIKDNASGIDVASAKAYVDGREVACTFANGRISFSDVTVADGLHTVKFAISDNMGNYNSVIRQIVVKAGSDIPTINLVPHDETVSEILSGSVYNVDLVATNIESVQEITVDLDMLNIFEWELEYADVADGFELSYTVEKYENVATITITRIGDVTLTGNQVIATIPVRAWEAKIDRGNLTGALLKEIYLTIESTRGILENTDGSVNSFTCDPMMVATELWMNQWNAPADFTGVTLHKHTAEAIDNKAPTCTEDGYTDRTFCEVCNSVVDWGTIEEAKGHDYQFVEGVLTCACGDLFNGTYTDGKFYVDGVMVADGWYEDTYYFIDGVAVVGQYLIDGTMCTFDENGVYQPDYLFTGFYHDGIGWTYYMANFQKKGFVVIDGNTHYFDDNTGYAPIGSFTLAEDRVYKVEGEQGKVIGGWDTFIVDGVERRRYYYSLRYYKNQWLEVDGDMYYFNNDGYALIGKRAVAFSGEYLGGYEFADDGKLIGAITGPFVDAESGYMYFAEDGVMACNKLVKYENDYYFARNNYLLITWGTYISEEQANGLLPAGEYKFGADGKLVMINGPVADPYNSAYLNFYQNGARVYEEGLYEFEGNYYYVRPNGLLLTWAAYVSEEKANGLLPAGEYKFGADGKLLMLNGPVQDAYNATYLNFYIDGIRVYEEGLYEYDGGYYYVRSNGLLLTWAAYVSEEMANGLLPAGEYKFGADGKLQMLNGPVEDAYNATYLNFYIDGIRVYEEGLYEYDGNYYYVRSNGLLLTWAAYVSEEKANGLLPAGEYKFGADGKLQMLNGPVQDAYNAAYLNFYIDGIRIYEEGLYEYEGDYYYVRSNGLLLTWASYISEEYANGLLPAGEYKFGVDGKLQMLNGPVADAYNPAYLTFYVNGIRVYEEGLYEYEGDYYYVRSNGLLLTWGQYISEEKTNGLLPAGDYTFGEDGKMIVE